MHELNVLYPPNTETFNGETKKGWHTCQWKIGARSWWPSMLDDETPEVHDNLNFLVIQFDDEPEAYYVLEYFGPDTGEDEDNQYWLRHRLTSLEEAKQVVLVMSKLEMAA